MYDVVKVVELVKQFVASCQRHGLCDKETFPKDFVGIIMELERYGWRFSFFAAALVSHCPHPSVFSFRSEFQRLARIMERCRGKTKFEQFKKGLARNDMIKEIQKCDRQMNRIFDRFMVSIFLLKSERSSVTWNVIRLLC